MFFVSECEFFFLGGYTTGPKELVDLLRQKARPYLFSNTLPPPVVASADKVFLTIENGWFFWFLLKKPMKALETAYFL